MNNKLLMVILGGVLLIFMGSAPPNYFTNENSIVIQKIEINITGLSTVGKYNCSTTYYKKDTISLNLNQKNSLRAEIPMIKFDCGNRIMTKDLQTTVKATQFPASIVTLTDLKSFGNHYKCQLNFVITNKTIRYKDFVLTKNNNKLQGVMALKFSDVGLIPPVKIGGLIKVKDEIEVYFSLYKL